MSLSLEFFVPGHPKTAGSKRAFPIWRGKGASRQFVRSVVVDDTGVAGKDWRISVQYAAKRVFGERPPLEVALGLELTFHLARPKYHSGAKGLKATAPQFPIVKPDVLKMARAVEDALTGIIWRDDAQIVTEPIRKRYADGPGVTVRIWEESL